MLTIEIFAALLTLLCVYLTTKGKLLSWPVGIWAVILYAVVFWHTKLYADFILQGIFAIQGVIGFLLWYYKGEVKDNSITKVEKLTNKQRVIYLIPILIAYLIIAYIFKTYTNASLPYIDSMTAVLSLVANQLLVKRKIENWYLWIFVDLVYVGMFLFKGLFVSSFLYLILLGLAVKGFYDWQKKVA
jgi:nicotinamide mononucleotide transporter